MDVQKSEGIKDIHNSIYGFIRFSSVSPVWPQLKGPSIWGAALLFIPYLWISKIHFLDIHNSFFDIHNWIMDILK